MCQWQAGVEGGEQQPTPIVLQTRLSILSSNLPTSLNTPKIPTGIFLLRTVPTNLLVLAAPDTPELCVLRDKLPAGVEILAVGKTPEALASWSDDMLA